MSQDHLTDFLLSKAETKSFFPLSFLEKKDREKAVKQAANRPIHPLVVSRLQSLNQGISSELDKSLEKLKQAGTVVVVTGQQLGFLGGPLHTLYKALTCIKYAEQLEAEFEIKVVPIFWLQSEDHDFKEISEAFLLKQGETLEKFQLNREESLQRDSVGLLKITETDREEALKALAVIQDISPAVKKIIEHSYHPGISFSESYTRLIHGLFSKFGLLVFDPLDKSIKEHMREFIATNFMRGSTIAQLLIARNTELEKLGYQPHVNIREKSPLFFLQTGSGRQRLTENDAGDWVSGDTSFSKDQLFSILENSPEKFTSSALIRPIFQDRLLPTAAYIAGPSEFKYWTQLPPLYEFLNTEMPLVVPRARFTILEKPYRRLLEKLEIGPEDVEQGVDKFVKTRAEKKGISPELIFSQMTAEIATRIEKERELLDSIDPALSQMLDKTKGSIEHNIGKLKAKYEKALKTKDSVLVAQFERLSNYILPAGKSQEAIISSLYYLRAFEPDFIDLIFNSIDISKLGKKISLDL
ncbi:MAG: bacillithiol biosynthesis cysteine-adding enzyme BshC [Bdellovibrionota bacterium]